MSKHNEDDFKITHYPIAEILKEDAKRQWLLRLCFSDHVKKSEIISAVDQSVPRLRPIFHGETIVGLAALSIQHAQYADFLSVSTVGGLASVIHGREGSRFVGYIDYAPRSAKRDQSELPRASPEAMKAWGDEQVELLKSASISPLSWCSAACSLADLGLDPIDVLHAPILLDGNILVLGLKEIMQLLAKRGLAILKSRFLDHVDVYNSETNFREYPLLKPIRNSGILSLEMKDGIPSRNNSFVGCIYRSAQVSGKRARFSLEKDVATSPFGPIDVIIATLDDAKSPDPRESVST